MSEPILLVEKADAVATLTLNRPEQMNALSAELRLAIGAAFGEIQDDPAVRVAIGDSPARWETSRRQISESAAWSGRRARRARARSSQRTNSSTPSSTRASASGTAATRDFCSSAVSGWSESRSTSSTCASRPTVASTLRGTETSITSSGPRPRGAAPRQRASSSTGAVSTGSGAPVATTTR